jgi:hypothetical protein
MQSAGTQSLVAMAVPLMTITMGLAVAVITGALQTALLSLNDLARYKPASKMQVPET